MVTKDINAIYADAVGYARKRYADEIGSAPAGIVNLSIAKSGLVVDDPKNPNDIVGIATTTVEDMDREVVLASGADLTYFVKNNAIFVDHEHDVESVVAKRRVLSPYPDALNTTGWRFRCSLIKGTRYEKTVRTLAREGVLACSVLFKATNVGRPTREEAAVYPNAVSIVRRWKWINLSFTSIPCNVDCRVYLDGVVEPEAAKSKRTIVVV